MSESPSQSTHALVSRRVQYRYCELCGAQVEPHKFGHDDDCPRNLKNQTGIPDLKDHSQEHMFELDPNDPIDCIEDWTYVGNVKTHFKVAYITVKIATGKIWYISTSGPRFDPKTGLIRGNSEGYLREEYDGWVSTREAVRAVIKQHLTLGNEYQ